MDPTKLLEDLLKWAHKVTFGDTRDFRDARENIDEAAEIVLSLDEWLTDGGFLPEQWRQ